MQINVGTTPGQAASAEIAIDSFGNAIGGIPTYSVVAFDLIPVATATDIFQLVGSATKTIKITRIKMSADSTGAAEVDFYGYKRTTANTGGTITHPTPTKYDSLNSAPTAVVNQYSANPTTLGTGTLFAATQFVCPSALTGSGIPIFPIDTSFGIRNNQALILRGVNESISISLGGNAIPDGLTIYLTIEWTEE